MKPQWLPDADGLFSLGVLVLVVTVVLVGMVADARVGTACVEAGNEWVDGDCVTAGP